MNIPACIRGAADWVRNFRASDVPQVAATVAIPITIRIAIASPRRPGQWAPTANATHEQEGGGDQGPQARREHQPGEQRRPRRGGGEQAVEPALLDVAREVDPGRGAGEGGALHQAHRDQEALVALGGEPRQQGQAPEGAGQPEEEDRRRHHAGDRGAGHAGDLVERAADQGADRREVGAQASAAPRLGGSSAPPRASPHAPGAEAEPERADPDHRGDRLELVAELELAR